MLSSSSQKSFYDFNNKLSNNMKNKIMLQILNQDKVLFSNKINLLSMNNTNRGNFLNIKVKKFKIKEIKPVFESEITYSTRFNLKLSILEFISENTSDDDKYEDFMKELLENDIDNIIGNSTINEFILNLYNINDTLLKYLQSISISINSISKMPEELIFINIIFLNKEIPNSDSNNTNNANNIIKSDLNNSNLVIYNFSNTLITKINLKRKDTNQTVDLTTNNEEEFCLLVLKQKISYLKYFNILKEKLLIKEEEKNKSVATFTSLKDNRGINMSDNEYHIGFNSLLRLNRKESLKLYNRSLTKLDLNNIKSHKNKVYNIYGVVESITYDSKEYIVVKLHSLVYYKSILEEYDNNIYMNSLIDEERKPLTILIFSSDINKIMFTVNTMIHITELNQYLNYQDRISFSFNTNTKVNILSVISNSFQVKLSKIYKKNKDREISYSTNAIDYVSFNNKTQSLISFSIAKINVIDNSCFFIRFKIKGIFSAISLIEAKKSNDSINYNHVLKIDFIIEDGTSSAILSVNFSSKIKNQNIKIDDDYYIKVIDEDIKSLLSTNGINLDIECCYRWNDNIANKDYFDFIVLYEFIENKSINSTKNNIDAYDTKNIQISDSKSTHSRFNKVLQQNNLINYEDNVSEGNNNLDDLLEKINEISQKITIEEVSNIFNDDNIIEKEEIEELSNKLSGQIYNFTKELQSIFDENLNLKNYYACVRTYSKKNNEYYIKKNLLSAISLLLDKSKYRVYIKKKIKEVNEEKEIIEPILDEINQINFPHGRFEVSYSLITLEHFSFSNVSLLKSDVKEFLKKMLRSLIIPRIYLNLVGVYNKENNSI